MAPRLQFNEGKVCDAILRRLEAREGARRTEPWADTGTSNRALDDCRLGRAGGGRTAPGAGSPSPACRVVRRRLSSAFQPSAMACLLRERRGLLATTSPAGNENMKEW